MKNRASHHGRGFTLVELMVVIGMIGVLAVCVVPAMSQLEAVREAGAAREVQRMFTHARTRAMGTGEPTGIAVDPPAGTLQLLAISGPGKAPAPAPDSSGEASGLWVLAGYYPGVMITDFVHGNGDESGTVWFAYDGTPQIRASSGAIVSNFGQDAGLTIGRSMVIVRKTSGLVERDP